MSKLFSFSKAVRRNTQLYEVHLFDVYVLISYETPVAFRYKGQAFRQENHWGPTTGRHLKEAGCSEWNAIADPADFETKLDQAILTAIAEDLARVRNIAGQAVARALTGAET